MMNIMQMLMQARQNPMAVISKRFQVPQGVQDPHEIVQHLLDSGQISQEQLNKTVRMSREPQFKQFLAK